MRWTLDRIEYSITNHSELRIAIRQQGFTLI